MDKEQTLLLETLLYEDGHQRRTEHILKVYALAKLLGEAENLPEEERAVLQAAAILHDIPIKYCKEHCGGDACQENQRREAPRLVTVFLHQAGYPEAWVPRILDLVEHHHDYSGPHGRLLGLLMEADLLVNCYEEPPSPECLEKIIPLFRTETGRRLLGAYRRGREKHNSGMKRKETTMEQLIDTLTIRMMDFDRGDPRRIQHFMKVHRFAQLIGHMEQVPPHIQYLVECAALVHDIGIHPAEQKYGRCEGKLQEQEGPAYARAMLTELGMAAEDVERICYLVGHHHTYSNVDGLDYQILLEADFLVNLYEDCLSREAAEQALQRVFRTESGKKLFHTIYDRVESELNR